MPTDTTETTGVCPDCGQAVGVPHTTSCRILAEVIVNPDRQAAHRAGPRVGAFLVEPGDLTPAGCGCPLILVDALGPRGGHPRPQCLRSTWITTVTRPTARWTPDGGTWTACWTDHTVSPHGIHLPRHLGGFLASTGFPTWDAAAELLDRLTIARTIRPVGVFLTDTDH
jgi:hypothetical protein